MLPGLRPQHWAQRGRALLWAGAGLRARQTGALGWRSGSRESGRRCKWWGRRSRRGGWRSESRGRTRGTARTAVRGRAPPALPEQDGHTGLALQRGGYVHAAGRRTGSDLLSAQVGGDLMQVQVVPQLLHFQLHELRPLQQVAVETLTGVTEAGAGL